MELQLVREASQVDFAKTLLKTAFKDPDVLCVTIAYESDIKEEGFVHTAYQKALEDLTACDCGTIYLDYVKTVDGKLQNLHDWAFCVWGNEPSESVNDCKADSWFDGAIQELMANHG